MDQPTVLVLEPDDQIRQLLISLLRREGYAVTATTRGDEAAIAFAMRDFDVFVVDVSLRASVLERGARRGLGFLHLLQQSRPGVLPRVVITSAIAAPQLGAGLPAVCRVLRKPFDIDELRTAIAECAQGAPASSRLVRRHPAGALSGRRLEGSGPAGEDAGAPSAQKPKL